MVDNDADEVMVVDFLDVDFLANYTDYKVAVFHELEIILRVSVYILVVLMAFSSIKVFIIYVNIITETSHYWF